MKVRTTRKTVMDGAIPALSRFAQSILHSRKLWTTGRIAYKIARNDTKSTSLATLAVGKKG